MKKATAYHNEQRNMLVGRRAIVVLKYVLTLYSLDPRQGNLRNRARSGDWYGVECPHDSIAIGYIVGCKGRMPVLEYEGMSAVVAKSGGDDSPWHLYSSTGVWIHCVVGDKFGYVAFDTATIEWYLE